MTAKAKGNTLIILGVALLVGAIYGAGNPWLAATYVSSPIRDSVRTDEFIEKPRLDEARVEQTKDLLKTIFGYKSDRAFNTLIFPQNYLEIRPTGGFPGTYLFTSSSRGQIESLVFDDIWDMDKPLEAAGKPQLNQYAWWSHFPHAARYAAKVYEDNTGQRVDAIMSVDPTAIKYLVGAIGPIRVPEYGVTVDRDNVTHKILEFSPYLPEKANDGPAKHKAFMGAVVHAIENRLSDYDTLKKRDVIAAAFLRGLERKHISLFFFDKTLQDTVGANRWGGALNAGKATDFLAIRDYNAGVNKVDLYIDRNIKYAVDLKGGLEKPVARLELTYEYFYDKQLHAKYGDLADKKHRQYKNILRVYVPKGARLLGSHGYSGYVKTGNEDGLRVFEGLVALNPNQRKTVRLDYRLPAKIRGKYSLYLNKQPGLPIFNKKAPAVRVRVNTAGRKIETYYPEYESFGRDTIAYETDLEFDRFIKIRLNRTEVLNQQPTR